MLSLLVGSYDAFSLRVAAPRTATRAVSPKMQMHWAAQPDRIWNPGFGDNQFSRRQELATYGGGAQMTDGRIGEKVHPYPDFGDNTASRRQELANYGNNGQMEGGRLGTQSGMYVPDFGDNTAGWSDMGVPSTGTEGHRGIVA